MSKGIQKHTGKMTVGKVLLGALGLIATGFCFAAGYDIYSRLFKKSPTV